jgi:murein DD-endopeptidase MepM/ murein hydrolase activator NlpD
MGRGFGAGLALCFLSLGLTAPAIAGVPDPVDEATVAAERLLGGADEEAQARAILPFTRQLTASGSVTGSLADSIAAAGVPAATALEVLRAVGTALDFERDLRNGDRFQMHYEQTFALAGQPIGVGRALWLELRTKAKGTIAVHRFRTRDGIEQFWLASNGQAAARPPLRLPLDTVSVSSGFGWRADPLDHPPGPLAGLKPPAEPVAPAPSPEEVAARARDQREIGRAFAGFSSGEQLGGARSVFDPARTAELDRIMAERRARAREAEVQRIEREAAAKEAETVAAAQPPAPVARKLFMHEGLDLVAPTGTPVYAAADGMVIGAGPNGRFGNWIRIKHTGQPNGRLTTVYGHLSGFAPGIEAGTMVARGELIGFVGNTGRSTGAHLHFELLSDGRPLNPLASPALRRSELAGVDLERFRKEVAAEARERDDAQASLPINPTPTGDL